MRLFQEGILCIRPCLNKPAIKITITLAYNYKKTKTSNSNSGFIIHSFILSENRFFTSYSNEYEYLK